MTSEIAIKDGPVNRLDSTMTPGQVARRKFKSALPRKAQNRTLTPMGALGETFALLDQFRGYVMAEKQSDTAADTISAALAYSLPDEAMKLALTLPVPEPGKTGDFCEAVLSLGARNPIFLGVVFVQVDPDAENTKYKAVSFVVPFTSGPDADARLVYAMRYAQTEHLAENQNVLEALATGRN